MKSKVFNFNTIEYDKLSISQLKRQADYYLRVFLLETTAGFGERVWCPLKKQSYHKDQMQVAHFIDRQCMALRYNLFNCHLISKSSNEYDAQVQVEGYKSKHHKEYEEWLLQEYEPTILDFLYEKSKEIKIFQRQDYIEVIEKFRSNE